MQDKCLPTTWLPKWANWILSDVINSIPGPPEKVAIAIGCPLKRFLKSSPETEKWIICAPEYNGSIPPILSNFIAWLSISGDDFRNLFNGQPIAIATFSGGPGIELITSLRIQLAHLGSQVVGRHLSANYNKPADEKTIEDILKRLMQMNKLTIDQ